MSDIRQADIQKAFISGPGDTLVDAFMAAMVSVAPFAAIFGPLKNPKTGEFLSWANYPRSDWSIRQLPAINVFESATEDKQSANAYLTGTVTIQVFWPPNFRRSDLSRIPALFKAAILNLIESDAMYALIDSAPTVNSSTKVPGLNQLGNQIAWSPNTEGLIEEQLVPVTMMDIRYRVDLRRWYMYLEQQGRTVGAPFEVLLRDWSLAVGEYDGVDLQSAPGTAAVSVGTTVDNN